MRRNSIHCLGKLAHRVERIKGCTCKKKKKKLWLWWVLKKKERRKLQWVFTDVKPLVHSIYSTQPPGVSKLSEGVYGQI